ncbi:uncharacterized protein [Drosophila suzukii]|uniref:Uncharacterized protein n=1 Tax=Drosophila suzukii TaxID=28584 RepID=A0ABM4U073_DROSZ
MCWQRCGHPFKARRHTCLASSLTYSCPYCPFSSVVKNPSGHRAKCEGDGVTAYLPDGPHSTLRRHWAGINNGEVLQPSRESSMSPMTRDLSEGLNALLSPP